MRTSLSVLCLADKVQGAEDPKLLWRQLMEKGYLAEGPAKTFLLHRNALLTTELRQRGVKLWDE
jgi:hypothetical protein